MDKIHNCIDLLCDYGYAERKSTLRETYESIVGIYNLERDNPKMWEMVWNHEINSLFQMEKQSGINGIAISKPKSVDELAVLNSVIRLMAPEKGAEQPLNMWARYRANIAQWYKEMREYGLTEEEIDWLKQHSAITDGICESQEGLMSLVQEPQLGGNSLTFADKCRKGLAKKIGKLFEECEIEYYKNIKEKGCSEKLAHYVWDVLLRVQRGYSFNRSHCLAYSLIALQEMNLAFRYPVIFWNCACLISDAGGNEESNKDIDEEAIEETKAEEPYYEEMEEFDEDNDEEESSYEEDDSESGFPATIVVTKGGKKKKKIKATNYGKVASAIGKIASAGVRISPPDINESSFTFSPDVEQNTIRYGLSGITRIGPELVQSIIQNRPYSGVKDFLSKIKVNKPQVVNLIKSGAFDSFGDRIEVMKSYIDSISGAKSTINLRNLKMLIDFGLIPDEYDLSRRVYNFNKYLKNFKRDKYYDFDSIAFNFFSKNFDVDILLGADSESGFCILQTKWDKIYQHHMDILRPYVKKNMERLKEEVNARLRESVWEKYCEGSISKWEMDAISCYIHPHELIDLNFEKYGLSRYGDLDMTPSIDKVLFIKGKKVPIFKLSRIAGTVLDRDKNKKIVTLLTTDGVVTVKIYGVFPNYDRQISEKGPDGKKHVIRKSEFSRGNKIIVTGIRQGDNEFLAKKYSSTPYHTVETIKEVINGDLILDNRETA